MFEAQYPRNYTGWKSRTFKVEYEGRDFTLTEPRMTYNDPIYSGTILAHDVVEHLWHNENYIGEITAFGAIKWVRYDHGMLNYNQYKGLPEEVVDLFISAGCHKLDRCMTHENHKKYYDLADPEYFLKYMLNEDLFKEKLSKEWEYDDELLEKEWLKVKRRRQSIINAFVKGYCESKERFPGHSGEWMFNSISESFGRLKKHYEDYYNPLVTLMWETKNHTSKFKVRTSYYNDETDRETMCVEYI